MIPNPDQWSPPKSLIPVSARQRSHFTPSSSSDLTPAIFNPDSETNLNAFPIFHHEKISVFPLLLASSPSAKPRRAWSPKAPFDRHRSPWVGIRPLVWPRSRSWCRSSSCWGCPPGQVWSPAGSQGRSLGASIATFWPVINTFQQIANTQIQLKAQFKFQIQHENTNGGISPATVLA